MKCTWQRIVLGILAVPVTVGVVLILVCFVSCPLLWAELPKAQGFDYRIPLYAIAAMSLWIITIGLGVWMCRRGGNQKNKNPTLDEAEAGIIRVNSFDEHSSVNPYPSFGASEIYRPPSTTVISLVPSQKPDDSGTITFTNISEDVDHKFHSFSSNSDHRSSNNES